MNGLAADFRLVAPMLRNEHQAQALTPFTTASRG